MENVGVNSPLVRPACAGDASKNLTIFRDHREPSATMPSLASQAPNKCPPSSAQPSSWTTWLAQYRQLQEQGEQLESACTARAAAGAAAKVDGAGREARARVQALHQARAQLGRQLQSALAQLQGIQEACRQPPAEGPAMPLLERKLMQFEGILGALQRSCTEQLGELASKETAAEADLEAASRSLHAVLEAALLPSSAGPSVPPAQKQAAPSALQPQEPSPQRQLSPRKAKPPASAAAAAAPSAQPELPIEVRECDEFMALHGPCGGWHPEDHAEFERILKACRGVYSHAVQICAEQLGLLHSRDDIIRHARWHEELQDLQQRKRAAIQQWRMQRAAKQTELLRQQAEQEEAEQRSSPRRARELQDKAVQQQREQQKQAVLEWKRAREERLQEQQRRQQEEERQRAERERQARQARQQRLAGALAGYKQQKAEQYNEQVAAADRPPSSRLPTPDPEAQQRLMQRNQALLSKRQELMQRHNSQAQQRETRLQQLQQQASAEFSSVERDPSRVLQATTAAQLRQLATTTEERGERGSGWIRHVQHKATPGWCGSR